MGASAIDHVAVAGAQVTEAGVSHGLRTVVARKDGQFMRLYVAPDGQALVTGLMSDLSVDELVFMTQGRLTELGTVHGLRGIFVPNGGQFQVFYATPDNQRVIPGAMFDAAGKDLTHGQIAPIPGAVPTVEIGDTLPGMPQPARGIAASPLKAVESTFFGTAGPASAPRLWMFIDPLCAWSVRAMEQLRPHVASGQVQLAVIPIAVLDPEDQGRSTVLAKSMLSQLGEAPSNDANGVFRGRAVALIGTLTPVLVWMRDHKSIPIDIEKVRYMVELKSIWTLAKQKVFLTRNTNGAEPTRHDVPEIPDALIYPLLAYLGEIPGYDLELLYNQQRSEKPSEQHGYAIFYFTQTFTQLAVSLGHIFKVQTGDIDMRDVVMNRRILIVNLPALEKSDDNLAALGRIVVASLRGMMAQLLGAKLEGDPHEIFAYKPGMGVGSFWVDFDELAYYATAGMDRMFAMGRGINMAFRIAFQELGGIWARLGEKTYSLLGNANLTVGMRQQDSGRTREWLEKTAGQSWVSSATSYQGAMDGTPYREAQQAEVRQVNRVDWQDFQRLLPGEAIVLFAGRRVYAKLFHVQLDIIFRPRLNRPLMLTAPDIAAVRGPAKRVAVIRDRIEGGLLIGEQEVSLDPVLEAMISTLAAAVAAGGTAPACIAAAVEAAGSVATATNRLPPPRLAACRSEVASVFACLGQSCVAGWR